MWTKTSLLSEKNTVNMIRFLRLEMVLSRERLKDMKKLPYICCSKDFTYIITFSCHK